MLPKIRWGSLRTKIIAWSFVPTAIILAAVALVTYVAYQRVTEELVIQRDQDVARLAAGQLAAELTEYGDLLSALARTSDVYRGDADVQKQVLERARDRLAVFDGGVLVLDTFGIISGADPGQLEMVGQDWSQHPCYQEALHRHTLGSGQPALSDLLAGPVDGQKVICIAVPITGEQGEFLGVMVGSFRLGATAVSAFYGDIVKLRIGKSGDTYLVDGTGRAIYHTNATEIGQDLSDHDIVEQVLKGRLGAIRTRNLDGQDIVASFAPVPGTSWFLVVEESWAALMRGSRRYQQFLLLLLGLGIAVPIFVVAVGVRRITRPIQEFIVGAREVARGDFGQRIAARTGDELEEMAEQFNSMAAQLQASYAQLEQRIADRTRELAALNAIAATVSRSPQLSQILDAALDETLQVMGIEAGGVYLLDEESEVLSIAASRGFSPEFVKGVDKLRVGEGFSGLVAKSAQPLVVADVSADPRLTRTAVREEGLRSLAIAPLSSKGRVVGTIFTVTRGYREFTAQDVQLLTSIGNQIGVAVDSARLFEAEQHRADQFRVIAEVGRRITSILDIDQVLVQVVRLIQEAFGYEHVGLALVEGDEAVYKVGAGYLWDDPTFQFRPARLKIGEQGITGWVVATGKPLLVPDVTQEPRYVWLEGSHTRSELTVPMVIKGQVLGVLDVQSDRLRAFDESDLVVLESLASQAAIAIENARNYNDAQRVAVVEERQRLARELHDAVTQTLFSTSLIAEALPASWEGDKETGRALLNELRQLTRGALAEMRTLLLELRPTALAESDLGDLLRQLAEAAAGREGLPVDVQIEGTCKLPPEIHVALYRIAQEALNNVVKHARAEQVMVSLQRDIRGSADGDRQMWAELRISDDGRGFDPQHVPPERLGLGIMQERAQAVGASLVIHSKPGHGTMVTVHWEGQAEGRSDGC